MNVDGVEWWTIDQAVAQLGVGRKVINMWHQRSKRAGHESASDPCPACADDERVAQVAIADRSAIATWRRFPHVDAPRGGIAYRADQLIAAELHTSDRAGRE